MSEANEAEKLAEAAPLQPLLDLANATYNERLSPRQRNVPEFVLQRWGAGHKKSRHHRLWQLSLAGCVAAAAIVLVVLREPPPPITSIASQKLITFEVQGGALEAGGYLRAKGSGDVTATFSEGTSVTFVAGARGRVLNTTAVGGRLSVEEGRAHVRVRPRPAATWVVHAGPYAVEVTGTEFLVDWSPPREQLELRLLKGSVTVRGPFAEGGIAMKAGQTLIIALPAGRVTLNQEGAEATQPSSMAPAKPSLRREPERPKHQRTRTAANATPGEEPESPPSWSAQVAKGDFEAVLRQAEHEGLGRVLQGGSLSQIAALADAARYARRSQLAQAALQAQRRRFPQAPQSREAVFFLARLAEDEGQIREAQALYEDYLNATVVGLYAGEALGRKMLLEQRQGRQAAAQELAKTYLAKYPNGSYATPARKLVSVK